MGKIPEGEPRSRVSKRFVAVPGDGFAVFNNTIYVPHMNLFNTLEMESAKPVPNWQTSAFSTISS